MARRVQTEQEPRYQEDPRLLGQAYEQLDDDQNYYIDENGDVVCANEEDYYQEDEDEENEAEDNNNDDGQAEDLLNYKGQYANDD